MPESLSVLVRDQGGTALPGVTVTWVITAGGGSVSPGSRATAASGIAKTLRTLGPNAGTQTVTASVSGLTAVSFNAVSQINGAVNVANSTTGPLTDTVLTVRVDSLVVLVTDQNATPIQGVVVTWAATGGSVSPTSRATTAAGESRARFTYGTAAGNQVATATVTGLVGSPVSITLNATAGNAVAIAKTAGDNVTASPGTQVTHTVQGQDSYGNPKAGVKIDWTLGAGGGSITPAQTFTAGVNGTAVGTRTLGGASGTQTAIATAPDLPSAPSVTYSTAAVWTVNVSDNVFTPTNRTITAGDSVTWVWQGTTVQPHNITFAATAGAPGDVGDRSSGTVKRTFATAGTFDYACTNHGGMNGTVTVTQ